MDFIVLLKKICGLVNRILNKIYWFYVKANYKGSVVEIDQTTVLENTSLDKIIFCEKPSHAIAVPAIDVVAKLHQLTVLSENTTEKEIYINRTFCAQGMTIECLFDQYWFPESGFLISKNGKVWRNSLLGQYADSHFLSTGAIKERKRNDGSKTISFYEKLLKDVPIIDKPILISSHYASHNYGHFMLDMVPVIQMGMKLGLNFISRPLLHWHKSIYQRIGANPDNITIISEKVVFLKKVFVSNRHNAIATSAASPHHREVFASILENIPQSSIINRSKRIFLSRGADRKRNLRNRSELESVLNKEGFDTVQPELLSFDEQALLFSTADIIVSEFGAVMANVVFCRKGTKIVEIIPDMQNDPWSRHLCASMGLEHVTLCHNVNDDDREAFIIDGRIHKNIYFSFDADIELIRSVIKQL